MALPVSVDSRSRPQDVGGRDDAKKPGEGELNQGKVKQLMSQEDASRANRRSPTLKMKQKSV